MIPPSAILLAPATIRLMPLFGQPRKTVERTLGRARNEFESAAGGHSRSRIVYSGGAADESVVVEYQGDRAQSIERWFSLWSRVSWADALRLCGLSPAGVRARPLSASAPSGVSLSGGSLVGFVATFGAPVAQSKPSGPVLKISPRGAYAKAEKASRAARLR